MELNSRLGLALLLVAIVAIGGAVSYGSFRKTNSPFAERDLLKKGDGLPRIWLYYDTSEVNSRWWMDFGARSSRALNVPFLNLCYETVVAQNGNRYRVEVINGLAGVADLLGGGRAFLPDFAIRWRL
jgi:hypothetical protein